MQMQQQTHAGGADHNPLTREQTIKVFKTQQDIQMESMDEMLKEGMNEPTSQQDQMAMMMKMMI